MTLDINPWMPDDLERCKRLYRDPFARRAGVLPGILTVSGTVRN